MKTKVLFTLLGLSLFSVARVEAATIFAPTDGDVNFLFDNLAGGTLAIFDDSDQSYAGTSLTVDVPGIVGIAGPFTGGDYLASNLNGTLTLTGSDNFILGLSIDNGLSWLADTSITAIGANSYTVSFGSGIDVVQVDVQIVPLPAAAWLFGSGLLGLAGIAGARQKRPA